MWLKYMTENIGILEYIIASLLHFVCADNFLLFVFVYKVNHKNVSHFVFTCFRFLFYTSLIYNMNKLQIFYFLLNEYLFADMTLLCLLMPHLIS